MPVRQSLRFDMLGKRQVIKMERKSHFSRVEHALVHERAPSAALQSFSRQAWFARPPFSVLLAQKRTPQSPDHHPEGNVWNHTLLVVDEAAKRRNASGDARTFMWAALLHDIGKPRATKLRNGRITAYDHDRIGQKLAADFLRALGQDEAFIRRTTALVRYHMHLLYVVKGLPFADVDGMRRETDLSELTLLGYCDRMGRAGADPVREREAVRLFLEACGVRNMPAWLTQEDAP